MAKVLNDQRMQPYDALLNAMEVSVWEVDISSISSLAKRLGPLQWDDLQAQLHSRPEALIDAMRGIRIVNANDYTVHLFGFEPKRAFQEDLECFWPEDASPAFIECLTTAAMRKVTHNATCKFRRRNGPLFDAMVTVTPDGTAGDGEANLFIAFRDISTLLHGVAELEQSEKLYRQLFQYMPVALTQVDAGNLVRRLTELRKKGIEDIGAYMDDHPNFLPAAIDSIVIEEVNQHSIDLLGERSAEDMYGSVSRYWTPSFPTMRRSIEGRFRGEVSFQEETKLMRSDGEIIDVLFTTSRHPTDPSKSLAGCIDISQQKKSEVALRRSKQRYQDLFQAMTISVLELDLSKTYQLIDRWRSYGITDVRRHLQESAESVREVLRTAQIIEVNEQSLSLFGGDVTMMVARTLDDFLAEQERERCAAGLISILREEVSITIDAPLRRINGSEFDAQFTLRLMTENPNRGLAAVKDVSDRVQAFNSLERSEQRYRDLFHYTPIPVLQISAGELTDRMLELKQQGVESLSSYIRKHPDFLNFALESTIIIHANAAAVELLGARDPEEFRGSVAPFWRNSEDAYIRHLENQFRFTDAFEELVTLTTLDGRVLEGMLTVASPPALAEVGLTLNAFVDLTEKRRAERQLTRLETDFAHAARVSVMGELAASIAHEIAQPLSAIAINGEAGLRWLSRPTVDLGKVQDSVSSIVSDARRAADIVSRLRAMALRRETEQEVLCLDDIIRESIMFLRHELQSKKIEVEHRPSAHKTFVTADRTQLQQVIVNLALNATQAMSVSPAGARKILFCTTADATSARCSVEDSGPGIPKQHITHLFDSFFSTKEGGMGMGLSVCRSIMETHRGSIQVEGDSALGGARFLFALPRYRPNPD